MKLVKYGLITLTSPIWFPLALGGYLAGYVAVKTADTVIRKPKQVLMGLAVTGALTYASYQIPWQDLSKKTEQIAEKIIEEPKQVTQVALPQVQSQIVAHIEPSTTFYYVKEGDTLSEIATKACSNKNFAEIIAIDNNIYNKNIVTAGQLLKLNTTYCNEPRGDVFKQVPELQSIVLKGDTSISDVFGTKTEEVININRALGLNYTNNFKYPQGERVVWFN